LSNSARKLLWFEIGKTLIAVLEKKILLFDYYNFRHTVVRFSLRAAFTDVIRKRSLEAAFTTTTRVGWALVRVAISSVTLTTLKRAATSFAAW